MGCGVGDDLGEVNNITVAWKRLPLPLRPLHFTCAPKKDDEDEALNGCSDSLHDILILCI